MRGREGSKSKGGRKRDREIKERNTERERERQIGVAKNMGRLSRKASQH